jgi:hypothetical protein
LLAAARRDKTGFVRRGDKLGAIVAVELGQDTTDVHLGVTD